MAKAQKKHKALVSAHGDWVVIETPFFASDPERYGYAETPVELGISPRSDKAAKNSFTVSIYHALHDKKPKYPFIAYAGQPGAEQELCFPDWLSLFQFLQQAAPIIIAGLLTALTYEKLPTWDEISKRYRGSEAETEEQDR